VIVIFLRAVSQRLGEYFYGSKLFFNIQTRQTMNTIEKKLVKASGRYVTTEHVDTLIRNYKKERWLQNSERIEKEDTLNLWLSVEELEEFLQTSKMNGADGVRVCFGVYGGEARAPKPEMVGKQTVAFVATSSEADEAGNLMHNDVYVERGGSASLLAYNMIVPNPTIPPTTTITLGAMMVADKEKGLHMI
jgi:hypothetical protein